jgi:TonB family protein
MRPVETWLLNYAVNALWQVPIVFAAAWLAARASRRAGPAFQHRLWATALVAEALLPACSARPLHSLRALLYFRALLYSLLPLTHTSVPQSAQVTVVMGPAHAEGGLQLAPALLAAVVLLYVGSLVYFAARLCFGLYRTAALRRRSEPVTLTGYVGQSYRRYAWLFGVEDAAVAASAQIAGPMTLGVRHRMLLLPAQMDAGLLGEDMDAALAHEFAHMRRRDFAKNLVYEAFSLPAAFHPLLWLTRSRLAESRELVCDAMAAEVVAGRQRYARSLLRLATKFSEQTHVPTPHAIGIFDAHPFKNFERRVMNLTHNSTELRGAARLATTALSLSIIGGACTTALAFRMQVAAPPTQTTTPPASTTTQSPAPNTAQPPAFTIGVPRSATGQPAQSFKVDIADASGPNPVVKVLTPPFVEPIQAEAGPTPHVGASVLAGNRDVYVAPIYPPEAKAAGIQGSVVLHAVIGKDGKIASLKLVSGPRELTKSAWAAVIQWGYKPYLLNGQPTAVDTTITVNYALSQ